MDKILSGDNWLARLAALIAQITKHLLASFNIIVVVALTGFLVVIGLLMIIFKIFLGV